MCVCVCARAFWQSWSRLAPDCGISESVFRASLVCCCKTDFPKSQRLKTTFTISQAFSFRLFHKLSQSATRKDPRSSLLIWLLAGCVLYGPRAVFLVSPLVPYHLGLSTQHLTTWQPASLGQVRERESAGEGEVSLLQPDHRRGVLSLLPYPVQQKQVTRGPTHTQWEGLTQAANTSSADHGEQCQKLPPHTAIT